jgi:hypothetical protein
LDIVHNFPPQALVNENADLVGENQRYVMRITGSDKEGQDQLGNRAGHDLAAALNRHRCADLPPDRARSRGGLDDRVQADRWTRHSWRERTRSDPLAHVWRNGNGHEVRLM